MPCRSVAMPFSFGKTHFAEAEIPANREISKVRKNGRIECKANEAISKQSLLGRTENISFGNGTANTICCSFTFHSLAGGYIFLLHEKTSGN